MKGSQFKIINSYSLSAPQFHSSASCSISEISTPKENKKTNQTNQPTTITSCHGSCGVSLCVTPLFKQRHLQMFIALNRWSVLSPLASAIFSILDSNQYSCCISSILLLSCVTLILWLYFCRTGSFLHLLHHFTDGLDVGVSQHKVLDLGLGTSWVGLPSISPAPRNFSMSFLIMLFLSTFTADCSNCQ